MILQTCDGHDFDLDPVRLSSAPSAYVRGILVEHLVDVPFDETVPTHVGADERSIDVDDLGGGDLRLETGLDRPLEDLTEALGAPSLPDSRQAGVVGKRLMQGVADEPADGDVDVSLTQELAIVHDPEQQPASINRTATSGSIPGRPSLW